MLRAIPGPNMNEKETPKEKAALLGVGLDNRDGQNRLTRGKNFVLVGGSKDTHGMMQETAIKLNERLDAKGKRLEDVSTNEMRDLIQEVTDSI